MNKNILVLGAGGFIGNAIVTYLVNQGYFVRGVDIKPNKFSKSLAHEFILGDLRDKKFVSEILTINDLPFDEVYHFAADMGGAEFIFTGLNDADILTNSSTMTLNILSEQVLLNKKLNRNQTKFFYASSACVYPEHNQLDPDNPDCREDTVYPASPDSNYGWEKIFGERLFQAYNKNYNIPIAIARYHNVYGPGSEYDGGREKAPAALCRKVLQGTNYIEIYGDGTQTRSFLYIDDAVNATIRLMDSNFNMPINIGSEEIISINAFIDLISSIENKHIEKKYKLDAPIGVKGRNSNNDLIRQILNWEPKVRLSEGITQTYHFIKEQLNKRAN